MSQRLKLVECAAFAIAIACSGAAFAADQEKDPVNTNKKKSANTSSRAVPGAVIGKSDTAGPGAAENEIPLKDRKIVKPDDFGLKDRKIVAPGRANPALPPADSPAKPTLAK